MQDWNLSFEEEAQKVGALSLTPGSILMGNGKEIEINDRANLDRAIQGKMYEDKSMQMWGIFYQDRDERTANAFLSQMQKCV
jgi:hypothetical protein